MRGYVSITVPGCKEPKKINTTLTSSQQTVSRKIRQTTAPILFNNAT